MYHLYVAGSSHCTYLYMSNSKIVSIPCVVNLASMAVLLLRRVVLHLWWQFFFVSESVFVI